MKVVTFSLVLVVLVVPSTYSFVPINDLFPFGIANGDAQLPITRGNFVDVSLSEDRVFNLFHSSYNSLFVNNNGAISFTAGVSEFTPTCGASKVPMIIPFLSDVDTRNGGTVYYRETTNSQVLSKATTEIRRAFPNINNINLDWAFIATWDNVAFFGANANCGGNTRRNTFQTILVNDDQSRSFVIILYNSVTWTTSTAFNGNCYGLGGSSAKAGFDYGNSFTFADIGGTCTDSILNILNTTNVNGPGKWVFRVDNELESPRCINRLQTEFEQLTITPSFISIFGNIPLTIQGPCLADASQVQIRFNDQRRTTLDASISDINAATCTVPFLNKNGRIKVDLIVTRTGGTVQTFWGYIYTEKHKSDLNFKLVNGSAFAMSWDMSNFESCASLDLELYELAGGVWTSRGIVKENIPNTGSFSGNLDVRGVIAFNNLVNVYAVKLLVSPRSLCIGVTVSIDHSLLSIILNDLSRRSDDEVIAKCNMWYIQDPGTSANAALPCPPTLILARNDDRFERIVDLWPYNPDAQEGYMTRVPSDSGAGQRCVYNNGILLVGPTSGGNVQSVSPNGVLGEREHIIHDLVAWVTCCYATDDLASCEKYYERRPSNNGSDYCPCETGCSIGDPHITTIDGLYYTFNGHGEFWFIKSKDNSFSMQGRTTQYMTSAATSCKAFVMQQRSCQGVATIQLTLTNNAIDILIDGQVVAFDRTPNQPKRTIIHNGASIAIYSQTDVRVTFSYGFSFQFSIIPDCLNLIAFATVEWKGKIRGLLGVYDGDLNNDFTIPDGTIYPTNASPQEIHQFGMEWIVNGEESLFTYPFGKTHENFQDIDFEPSFFVPDFDTLPPEALELCKGSIECLFDLIVTGNVDLAINTQNAVQNFNNVVNALGVNCIRPTSPRNGHLYASNFRVGSTVRLICDGSIYEIIGHDTITCVRDVRGELSWDREFGECYNKCESDNEWEQYLCEIGIGL